MIASLNDYLESFLNKQLKNINYLRHNKFGMKKFDNLTLQSTKSVSSVSASIEKLKVHTRCFFILRLILSSLLALALHTCPEVLINNKVFLSKKFWCSVCHRTR
jgi:hypothetical protein